MFESASFHVSGVPALIIILIILALIITGTVALVRKGKSKIEGK